MNNEQLSIYEKDLPEGWKVCRLGELITLNYGKSLPASKRNNGNIPVYGSSGLTGWHDSPLVESRGLIIGRKGTIGKVKKAKSSFYPIDTTYYITPDDSKCDFIYLFYLLTNMDLSQNEDSAVPGLNRDTAYSYIIHCPPLTEQRAIAEVLSSLDDKIDLLHQQNKTLEDLAQTLFRQWFIEQADEGWEEKNLKEICTISNGYAFKSNSYILDGHKVIRTLNFSNGFIDLNNLVYVSEDLAKKSYKYSLNRKDFLLVMVGANIGTHSVVTNDILPALQNQNMWRFKAKNSWHQHYLNFSIKNLVKKNLYVASGSARHFFQKTAFYKNKITMPPDELIKQFDKKAELFFSKIENNRKNIQTLEQTRDTLLPKLMSGEVRV